MVEVLCHNSIKITEDVIIYIDPYKINKEYQDADYIFFTHSHYDHFSPEDIEKVKKESTIFIVTEDIKEQAEKLFGKEKVFAVVPNENYHVHGLDFKTTYAYNIHKAFHPKGNKWVGYIIEVNHKTYYIAGDTDNIEEIQNIECDEAFIPIGGTYTMDYQEAAKLANTIKAKVVIPTHYGCIVGDKEDAKKFKELVKNKEVKILIN